MITVTGLNETISNLSRVKAQIEEKIQEGIKEVATDLLNKSKEIVPYKTGALQESGHIEEDGKNTDVVFDKEYAIKQHENMFYRHAPGRQAKYLEKPFQDNLQSYEEKIKDKITEVIT